MEKYAVDRIEGDFAVLENIKTREIKLVELLLLPVVKDITVSGFASIYSISSQFITTFLSFNLVTSIILTPFLWPYHKQII